MWDQVFFRFLYICPYAIVYKQQSLIRDRRSWDSVKQWIQVTVEAPSRLSWYKEMTWNDTAMLRNRVVRTTYKLRHARKENVCFRYLWSRLGSLSLFAVVASELSSDITGVESVSCYCVWLTCVSFLFPSKRSTLSQQCIVERFSYSSMPLFSRSLCAIFQWSSTYM